MVTYTTTYSLAKPTVADDEDVWGGYLNGNFDTLESLLKGTTALTAINVTGNITVGGTVDGRDIAADGSKLDGIESGATADQTKADIDALGINAATLDSLDSTQFLRSDASDSMSGDLSISQATAGTATLEVRNTGGSGNNALVAKFWGDSDGLEIRNHAQGDYRIVNPQQDNGISIMDGTGGVFLRYNGVDVAGCDNSGGFEVTSGNLNVTNNITVGGTVDGVDIAGSIDQALLTTSSPTFSALTITNQLEMSNSLDMNNYDIYGVDQIRHHGDTNTYIQFHAADQFRVVTGGSERFEVNNTRTQADRLLVSGGLYEDYDALSGTTPSVDVDAGGGFSLTMTGNTTFTFAGAAIGASTAGFVIELTGNGGTVTWPSSVKWAGGTAPDAPASGETDLYVFYTRDGGTNWYGVQSIDAAA